MDRLSFWSSMQKSESLHRERWFFICTLFFVLALALPLASCSFPFGQKKLADVQEAEKGEKVQEAEPKPGDVKLVDGVEYIYARNRRFQLTPYEPEYLWIRKDEYSPGIFESITAGTDKKEREELERRMAKLEAELKKNSPVPQISQAVPAAQTPTVPASLYATSLPQARIVPRDSKLKRRILVLPVIDETNCKELHLAELATRKLMSSLERTGTVIPVDPSAMSLTDDLSITKVMDMLELHGIHAVIKTTLAASPDASPGPDKDDESKFRLSAAIFNTDTKVLLRQLSAHTPVVPLRAGDSDEAASRAIGLAIGMIGDDTAKIVGSLDWSARIASIEKDRIILNAGRLSGIEKGDVLEVYSKGNQVFDKTTHLPLGQVKGSYKGEIEVYELFGVDAALAKLGKGGTFSTTDVVYLKK
ncbi:MAG: hypothetical protein A4E57_03053 [Syntrophorhabdaceae bacterium PtaU1.Bin034]|nr:MAG: hypothetical protein A4E57_03053 [Syntrophorhabdaceae bacterium PtaU1.Bin034]